MKEVALNKFFGENPELFTAVINNLVLVRVIIDGVSAGRSSKEVRKKVN